MMNHFFNIGTYSPLSTKVSRGYVVEYITWYTYLVYLVDQPSGPNGRALKFCLKAAIVGAATTSSGRLFQGLTYTQHRVAMYSLHGYPVLHRKPF